MGKRLKICLILNLILSIIGVFVALHLVELHYKNPQHQRNLAEKHPNMSSFMTSIRIIAPAKNENEKYDVAASIPESYDPYKNVITSETQKNIEKGFRPKESCDISEELSCTAVDESSYSEIWGIAVALYGLSGNILFTLLTLLLLLRRRKHIDALSIVLYAGGYLGFGFVIYLTALETFIIHSYCPYCLVSAALMTCCLISLLIGFGKEPFVFLKRDVLKKHS